MSTSVRRLVLSPATVALFLGTSILAALSAETAKAQTVDSIRIPLKHVPSDDDPDDFNSLGIMIGANGSTPRLYMFDTGSDEFIGQFDSDVPGITPLHGKKPEPYMYGNGSYGYWLQRVQFSQLSFFDPNKPSDPIATMPGHHAAGQILDWVYTKHHPDFKNIKIISSPVGYDDGTPLYASVEVRNRIKRGQPSDHPPFYGTFGAGDYIDMSGPNSALGSQTQTGYVIAANSNLGDDKTPGCAPCLILHLSPSLRAQFTALTPWGKLEYDVSQRKFIDSNANASNSEEGLYDYTISFTVGKKKRAVEFKTKAMFDTGTAEFIYLDDADIIKRLRANGLRIDEYGDADVDIKFNGFSDKINDIEYDDIDASRLSNEDGGGGLTVGLPFFQENTIMYDLENRLTAYSPYFVSTENFTTDPGKSTAKVLTKIDDGMGSRGWFGLAGKVSGSGGLRLEADSHVRMTNVNTYTGPTTITEDALLTLAGLGSIEHSSRVIVDGALVLDQKGGAYKSWGVPSGHDDVVLQDLAGKGDIYLGSNRLIIQAGTGSFGGMISDVNDAEENAGGGLVLASGKLTLSGETDYSGLTEVADGAELHITGSLIGDVSVNGKLIVDRTVSGTVHVNRGGQLSGRGSVGSIKVQLGGAATKMKSAYID